MTKIYLTLLMGALLLVGCSQSDLNSSIADTTLSNDLLSFEVGLQSETKAALVNSEEQMGSIGIYCAYTASKKWSSETIFDKMENEHLNYDSASGKWIYKEDTPTWGYTASSDKYTFMAYSPFGDDDNGITPTVQSGNLVVSYSAPQNCLMQPDLMLATPRKDIYPQVGGVVMLNFNHALAAISFSVKGSAESVIKEISITNVVASGECTITDDREISWSLGDSSSLIYGAVIDDSIEPKEEDIEMITLENGYLMMIPQDCRGVEVSVLIYTTTTETSTTEVVTLSDDLVWEAGKIYNYIINTDDTENYDYTIEGTANCYMLHPNGKEQTFYIPVEGRINTFWRDYADDNQTYKDMLSSTDEWSASVLWSDVGRDIIDFSVERVTSGFTPNQSVDPLSGNDYTTAGARSAMKITLPSDITEGNILIAIEHNNMILWSWHLWITDYNPDLIAANNSAVQGRYTYETSGCSGEVHRYDSEDLWATLYDGRFIMDRNLGAFDCDYPTERAGVLHYQFGRKDPFPATTSISFTTQDSCVSFAEAVQNPTLYYVRQSEDYSWCEEGLTMSSNYLWFDKNVKNDTDCSGKSIFDPSPLGWRVPRYGTFSALTNSNCKYYNSQSTVVYNDDIIFPMTGYRSNRSGDVNSYGDQGNLRMSTQYNASYAYNLSYSPNVNTGNTNTISDGFCIRCIEE